MDKNEDLKTVSEVAKHFRVDDGTVRRWIKNGTLEAVILPHGGERQSYRIKTSEIRKIDPEYQG